MNNLRDQVAVVTGGRAEHRFRDLRGLGRRRLRSHYRRHPQRAHAGIMPETGSARLPLRDVRGGCDPRGLGARHGRGS